MIFKQTSILGVWAIEPAMHEDHRGHFFRAWCSQEFADHGINFVPVQENMARSNQAGTVRGMHFQVEPAAEAKLVRCVSGAMFDVALDLRVGSPTYRQWFGIDLTAENGRMLYLPEGCAHGYQTLEDRTAMQYMTSQYYTPTAVRGMRFNDPVFAIKWPLDVTAISEQDRTWDLN